MNLQEALDTANAAIALHRGKHLSDLEKAVLQGAWEGLTYQQMDADRRFPWTEKTLKDAGASLWKCLSQALSEPVKKTNFKAALERYKTLQAQQTVTVSPSAMPQDWGEVVAVPVFFGRSAEFDRLHTWITRDRCRLVAIVGMGGIGKTALAVRLTEQLLVQGGFDRFIWRSLKDAPPLDQFLSDLAKFVSGKLQAEADLLKSLDDRLNDLINHLSTSRCLIVLDNVDTLLCGGKATGTYRPGYENYGRLFTKLGSSSHQSCILLTSREKITEVQNLEGVTLPVRLLPLSGLELPAAQQILNTQGMTVFEAESEPQALVQSYAGNPLALKIVATAIHELFDGSITEFLQHSAIVFGDIQDLLHEQFDRLSEIEQSIMFWLAIFREPASLSDLQASMVATVTRSQIVEALTSLKRRFLIEQSAANYTQQPVVMEYMTQRLIERVCQELVTEKLDLFVTHALIQAQAKDYILESQTRLILEPIARCLQVKLGGQQPIVHTLNRILARLRQEPFLSAYGGGNLINLLQHLKADLTGYDFSYLMLWQADLRNATLHQVNFAHAELSKSVFAEVLSYTFSVAFSPDGTLMATAEESGKVHIWQVASGKRLLTCLKHAGWAVTAIFSPDGQVLASCGYDRAIRLWDVHTGRCLNIFEGHSEGVVRIVFTPDGERLISCSQDRTLRLWNVRTGECLRVFTGHTNFAYAVAISSDGKRLASGSFDRTVKLWDIETAECLRTLAEHTSIVWAVAFAPDDNTLATASDDHTIKLWNPDTGECLRTLHGHDDFVMAAAFSPDGKMLASGSFDQTIRLWDKATGQCRKILQGNASGVWSVAFSPIVDTAVSTVQEATREPSYLVASGHEDRAIRLWNTRTGSCFRTMQGKNSLVQSVTFSSIDSTLATTSLDQVIRLWDIDTGECVKLLQGHRGWVWRVNFSPDGSLLASASKDHTVRLWNVKTGQCLQILHGHTNWVWAAVFSPDGQTIVSCSHDLTLKLWSVATGQCLKTLRGHTGFIRAVAFSPDGQMLASGDYDQTIRLWNVRTGECLKVLRDHTSFISSIVYTPDGQHFISGSDDRTARIWDAKTGECLRVLDDHCSSVLAIAITPDGSTLATGGTGNPAKLWDVHTGNCLKVLQGSNPDISFLDLSADGRILAGGGQDEVIDLWDIQSSNHLKTMRPRRLYEELNITGAVGLTEAQKSTLQTLGAVEHELALQFPVRS